MRLKNVPGAREKMQESEYVFTDEESSEGKFLPKSKWKTDIFKNQNPLHIEIGTGKGRFITKHAKSEPDVNFVGIEKYSSVLIKALNKQNELKLENLKLIRMDAEEILDWFGEGEVDKIYLNFSDPWPKDRHAKRRLTSDRFLPKYEKILAAGGVVEFKTDNRPLFDYSLETIKQEGWEITGFTYDLHNDEKLNEGNICTEYEIKFSEKGSPICKLIARPVRG